MLSQVTHHSAIFLHSVRNTARNQIAPWHPMVEMDPLVPAVFRSYATYKATRFPSATRCLIV